MSDKQKVSVPTVFVTRHGETKFNTGDPDTDRAKGIMDLPLVEKGHEKAKLDGKELKAFQIAEVHHSPLKRSAQSAQHIASATGGKLVSDPGLDPWDIGYLGGQLRKDVADRVDYYIAHKNRPVPDGEPYGDFWKRITEAFSKVLKRSEGLDESALAVVGHSDGIEALTSWLDGTIPGAQTASNGINPGAILIFEKKGGKWTWREWAGSASHEKDEE
jgi:broad specificity phosphatase PhoE